MMLYYYINDGLRWMMRINAKVFGSAALSLFLALPLYAAAQTSMPSLANCTRSANLLACSDQLGNRYSVATAGNTIYLRGFEAADRRYWAQTNTRYGQLPFSRASPRMGKAGWDTAGELAGPPLIAFRAPEAAKGDSFAAA